MGGLLAATRPANLASRGTLVYGFRPRRDYLRTGTLP
jgi:hypothetical protein